jgi:hypothetical protein
MLEGPRVGYSDCSNRLNRPPRALTFVRRPCLLIGRSSYGTESYLRCFRTMGTLATYGGFQGRSPGSQRTLDPRGRMC